MDTSINLSIYSDKPDQVFALMITRLKEIENRMSAQKNDSELSKINQGAGKEAVTVSPDTFMVIKDGLEVARLSKGAFDPTIGPLVDAWAIGSENPRVPPADEIKSLLALVDYRAVTLDESKLSVFLQKQGMKMDLGGIAKGYAADEMARICKEQGVESAVIDLGGNILVVGSKPTADGPYPWNIGIQVPELERGTVLGNLKAESATVVTSGDYERFFIQDGIKYHHILDPKTGYPAKSGIVQVSIYSASNSEKCDGFSTSAFVLGLADGAALIDSLPGFSALFVTADNKVYPTSRFPKDQFILKAEGFSMEETPKSVLSSQS